MSAWKNVEVTIDGHDATNLPAIIRAINGFPEVERERAWNGLSFVLGILVGVVIGLAVAALTLHFVLGMPLA